MKNSITFTRTGYGQWKVTTEHFGKEISMHFTDAPTYDLKEVIKTLLKI